MAETGGKPGAGDGRSCAFCGGETAKGVLKAGNQEAQVVVAGKPDAFLGVIPYTTSQVMVRVCRNCGHIGLFAKSLESLLSMGDDA